MAKSSKRPKAILDIHKLRKIASFILKGNQIILSIGNHPEIFVTPHPTLAQAQSDFDKLQAAEVLAKTRVVGSAAARDVVYTKALTTLRALMIYVQRLADAAGDEQTAIAIIEASGFGLRINGVWTKPPLVAKNSKVSGLVHLFGKAKGRRASYNWQKSLDGGITWVDLPTTLAAKTSADGFARGTWVWFRMRAVLKDGPQDWTEPVPLTVL